MEFMFLGGMDQWLVWQGTRNSSPPRRIFNEQPLRDVFSWSITISCHTQAEEHNEALASFHEMVNTGIRPNEVTMVSILSAIASIGSRNPK